MTNQVAIVAGLAAIVTGHLTTSVVVAGIAGGAPATGGAQPEAGA